MAPGADDDSLVGSLDTAETAAAIPLSDQDVARATRALAVFQGMD